MSHFYVSARGGRGAVSRTGTVNSGVEAHARGWGIGGRVVVSADGPSGANTVDVFRTDGSAPRSHARHVVRFIEGDPSPHFSVEGFDFQPIDGSTALEAVFFLSGVRFRALAMLSAS